MKIKAAKIFLLLLFLFQIEIFGEEKQNQVSTERKIATIPDDFSTSNLKEIIFSPDGKDVYYTIERYDPNSKCTKTHLIKDSKEIDVAIRIYSLKLTKSNKLLYILSNGYQSSIVFDNKKGPMFYGVTYIGTTNFSLDGNNVVYKAYNYHREKGKAPQEKYFLVINNEYISEEFNTLMDFQFNPVTNRVAYIIRKYNEDKGENLNYMSKVIR